VITDQSLCDGEHSCYSVCDNADWMNEVHYSTSFAAETTV